MLNLLKIKNVALIDELEIEFGSGLNLLTGETGSGKSIIVDSLGALAGERASSDLIKDGTDSAQIEGEFSIRRSKPLLQLLDESGIEMEKGDIVELIVRRDISATGKNRIFVNGQLVTAAFLKRLGAFLVDIHGQGEQSTLFDTGTHLELLDEFARLTPRRDKVAAIFDEWVSVKAELTDMQRGESEKLQLLDILKFQVDEIKAADLKFGEEAQLEEEKHRLNNVEKLSALSTDALTLLYDADESTVSTLDRAAKKIVELSEFDSRLAEYNDGIVAAQAVLQDLSFAVRNLVNHLEFSPERLEEIESRLAEITRISRKYGGTVESAIEHLETSAARLDAIENAEFHQEEVKKRLDAKRSEFLAAADELHLERAKAALRFGRAVEAELSDVALSRSRFEVRVAEPDPENESHYSPTGYDSVEFFFSANAGEAVKPLARVASGGEASRLMLILKTVAKEKHVGKAVVFDEIDAGIGGRVAEAVGLKLKELSANQQVLCVTHQAQVASKADDHLVVEKSMTKNTTSISVRTLNETERVEEIARMLAGEKITDAARENAKEMIAAVR